MGQRDTSTDRGDAVAIYQALKRGEGHDRVTEDNVQQLIEMAMEYGDTQTETLLREWRSPCGDDNATPPPRGSGNTESGVQGRR